MTTVSRSQVATTRNARDGLAVGRQAFRSHLLQTSEHLDAVSDKSANLTNQAAVRGPTRTGTGSLVLVTYVA